MIIDKTKSSSCMKSYNVVYFLTVYGCCPDGAMPAKGPNNEGCPGQFPYAFVPDSMTMKIK